MISSWTAKMYVFLLSKAELLKQQTRSGPVLKPCHLSRLPRIQTPTDKANSIPFVTGASMALVAFFAGQRIMQATRSTSKKLPSPHQVSILIGLLNGGSATPLWETVKYKLFAHETLVQPVNHPFLRQMLGSCSIH